ncbi:MAG: hypothetical protein JNK95_10800 [Candidatus Competibacter sp.]|nr:hypothetical protein [Candidatus Competibacter sp.]
MQRRCSRRRPLQDAHGMERQGKSSLAARVANRLHHREPVVVFKHYDASAILEAFRRAITLLAEL